jgi:hypothetical protein
VARWLIVALALLVALPVAAAEAAERPGIHYASRLDGTDAFIGIANQGACFKAYLSDGTAEGATLSVWFRGCLGPDGRTLSAERGGVRLDAQLDRRTANGTVTLRDGSAHPFTAVGADRGGIVGKRFTYQGRRYRSGWVVLTEANQVRAWITPIGRGIYGDSAPPTGSGCDETSAERDYVRAQLGPLLALSGKWELRNNYGRGPTSGQYYRLGQAIGALDERIFKLDNDYYDCG